MKKIVSVLLVMAMVICCAQFLAIDADAANTGTGQRETKGWFASLWEWLFPPKEDEKKTVEDVAPTIVGVPATISKYEAYRIEAEKIDNSALRNTPQLHRPLPNGELIGMCNLCAMETLLNRRVAYDFGDYSSPFDDYDMFNAIGVTDQGNGIHKDGLRLVYYLDKGIGTAQDNNTKYKYSDTVTYHPVLLRETIVADKLKATGLAGLDAQYAVIVALLQDHPEGIWLRTEYYGKDGPHAIVITDYTEENGKIQLYAIDPVSVRDNGYGRKPIEKLYFYRNNYKGGMIGSYADGTCDINIAYLEQVGQSSATNPGTSTPPTDNRTPTLTISGQNNPETLKQGSRFGLRGTVKTDCGVISSLYGEITDSSGNVVQYGQYYPNKASANLRYTINNDLIFDRLSAGSYVYRVQATAKNGSKETTQTLIDCPFLVQGEQQETVVTPETPTPVSQKPTVQLSGETLPSSLQQGSNFGIRGTVSTDCGTITYLHGGLFDAAGNEVQSGKYYPNASSVDLRYTINNNLIFDNLSAGEYTYFVEATAKNGSEQTTKELIRHVFRVAAPAETEPARTPVLSISGQNLPQDQKLGANFGIRGTVSTDCGTITELYGAILDSDGNAVCSGWYNPYSTTVDLRTTINNDLVFGSLGVGSYTYYVQARAENNGQQTVQVMIEHTFTVGAAESQQTEPALVSVGYNMTVNVGKGSTLRFCSTVSTANQYEIGSLPNNAVVYVYGYTQQQYEGRTWAKISYNGTDGWVNYKWLA